MRSDGQTDRRTDMTKQIIAFRSFANAPKMAVCILYLILHSMLFDEFNIWVLSLEMKYSANLKCEPTIQFQPFSATNVTFSNTSPFCSDK